MKFVTCALLLATFLLSPSFAIAGDGIPPLPPQRPPMVLDLTPAPPVVVSLSSHKWHQSTSVPAANTLQRQPRTGHYVDNLGEYPAASRFRVATFFTGDASAGFSAREAAKRN